MADSRTHSGGQDRTRINVHQDYELRDWSQHFGVTAEQLKEAVREVGDRASDVEQYLANHAGAGQRRDH